MRGSITRSNVLEKKRAAVTLRAEREGALSWFQSQATNAILERPNSAIQLMKRAARNPGTLSTSEPHFSLS